MRGFANQVAPAARLLLLRCLGIVEEVGRGQLLSLRGAGDHVRSVRCRRLGATVLEQGLQERVGALSIVVHELRVLDGQALR